MVKNRFCAAFHDKKIFQSASRLLVCFALLGLTGCASYLKPYVPLYPEVAPSVSTTMPKLKTTVAKIDAWGKSAEDLRNSVTQNQRLLNMATFGFALGAGAASIYDAHRDTVIGLGLLASASYTGGTLFAPADQTTLYGASIKSLICIRSKADHLLATVESAEKRRPLDLQAGHVNSHLQPSGCRPSSALHTAINAAERARIKTVAALNGVKVADDSAASLTENAARNVVTSLNDELGKRAASAEAVLAAARSAISMAAGIGSVAPQSTGAPKMAPQKKPPEVEECLAPAVEEVTAIETRYKALETVITSAFNALAALDTSCVFNAPALIALGVSQDNITLATDSSYVITISGGRPAYTAEWLNAVPTGVSRQLIGSSIVLSAGSGVKSGEEYTLEVSDSALIPSKKVIKLKIK